MQTQSSPFSKLFSSLSHSPSRFFTVYHSSSLTSFLPPRPLLIFEMHILPTDRFPDRVQSTPKQSFFCAQTPRARSSRTSQQAGQDGRTGGGLSRLGADEEERKKEREGNSLFILGRPRKNGGGGGRTPRRVSEKGASSWPSRAEERGRGEERGQCSS